VTEHVTREKQGIRSGLDRKNSYFFYDSSGSRKVDTTAGRFSGTRGPPAVVSELTRKAMGRNWCRRKLRTGLDSGKTFLTGQEMGAEVMATRRRKLK